MTTYKESLTSWKSELIRAAALIFSVFLLSPLAAQIDTTDTQMPGKQKRSEVEEFRGGTISGEQVKEQPESPYFTELRSPKKAAIMSALLPGLGQAYNKKYWKIPIQYAGFAVAGWYLNDNLTNIQRYRTAFLAETDGDPATVNDTGFNRNQLEQLMDQYTEWRDLSYIAFGIIYILGIVDASVDAHLFYFDVSEDISMNIRPHWSPLLFSAPGLSLTLKL